MVRCRVLLLIVRSNMSQGSIKWSLPLYATVVVLIASAITLVDNESEFTMQEAKVIGDAYYQVYENEKTGERTQVEVTENVYNIFNKYNVVGSDPPTSTDVFVSQYTTWKFDTPSGALQDNYYFVDKDEIIIKINGIDKRVYLLKENYTISTSSGLTITPDPDGFSVTNGTLLITDQLSINSY